MSDQQPTQAGSREPVLIKTNSVLDVPATVQICPYCGGELYVQFSCWTQDYDGTWKADGVELECNTEPGVESDDWADWHARHSQMPYVYWLPATVTVERWVNANYRFDISDSK